MWVRCMASETSMLIPRGATPRSRHRRCRFRGARFRKRSSPSCLPNSWIRSPATSAAISSLRRSPISTPRSRASWKSFCSSLISYPGTSPRATERKNLAMYLPWSPWEAVPAAIFRAKFLAEIVSGVAPQTPTLLLLSSRVSSLPLGAMTRQGPIAQMLQQLPSPPMGQGFMLSARSNTTRAPSWAAFSSISSVAGSTLFNSFSAMIAPQILTIQSFGPFWTYSHSN